MNSENFTEEQKQYLDGFVAGSGLRKAMSLPQVGQAASVDIHRLAQDRQVAAGGKLVAEEQAKRNKNGLDLWDQVAAHAREGRFPKGTDVFLFKFQGLFYVAPAQDSFMARLRFPGGILSSHQMRGLADLAQDHAGGYADVTTRANLQLREIGPRQTVPLLMGLADLGIIHRGAGADNIRNVTASPTAGIDRQELIDTRGLARELHYYILNHREMYGLPRKFNIAFDGGGTVSALEDTNDIGFTAVRAGEGKSAPAGVYFRLTLGGITGHRDFARDTGYMVRPGDCTLVSHAIVNAFSEQGDRTDRKKARLKYVLDRMGLDAFMKEVDTQLGRLRPLTPSSPHPLIKFALDDCEARPGVDRNGHIGVHAQKQDGLFYIGVVLPVGRMTATQMRGLARIAQRHGSGTIRLTVWQNLLISDIAEEDLDQVKLEVEALGLGYQATNVRAGLVACTGSAGCKYAAAETKRHAMEIAKYVEARVRLDSPVNIHLTGCHHSCAQHYIGDVGLLATQVASPHRAEEMVEGYHLYVGGGYGEGRGIGRELYRDVPAGDAPRVVERLLRAYLDHRSSYRESFVDFVRRHEIDQLKELLERDAVAA
ncbi:MAG TPA: NirA family protein [Tepidisphaeraceae bacterium]